MRNNVKDIAHNTEISDIEDGGIGVFIHSDDVLGGLHAGEVLDCARDTERDIEVGGHGHAGLSDLGGVVDVACVDGGAGGPDGGTEGIGKLGNE